MQLSLLTTLATIGALVSAIPTGEVVPKEATSSVDAGTSDAQLFSKRAWPQGECYGSGIWGKNADGLLAIEAFCAEVFAPVYEMVPIEIGHLGIGGTARINPQYKWDFEIKPRDGKLAWLRPDWCREQLRTALYNCQGNNEDSRGGNGPSTPGLNLWIRIDPNV